MKFEKLNVFGLPLAECSSQPLTGFFRDGCCNTNEEDFGMHTVCAIMTVEFLTFSKAKGNDLTTPMPQFQFLGLKAGDKWCLCASRWLEAWQAGTPPLVHLEATHQQTLSIIPIEILLQYAYKAV